MSLRVSTSTLYENQTNNIFEASSQLQKDANELSSGISLNLPSDNPIAVSQVMQLNTDISTANINSTNAQIASNQLTSVDGALSNLTDVIQQVNTIAVQGANGLLSSSDRQTLANQVNQLFSEVVSIANTEYNGSYIFAGTAATPNGPVAANGSPASGVNIYGNNQIVTESFGNGQNIPLSTSLQQAFNIDSADGSSSVFQVLLNLRDALEGASISIESNGAITAPGGVITDTTPLSSAAFANPLKADSNGNYAMTIAGSGGTQTLTFTGASTLSSIVAAINASTTGVTASYNVKDAQISLSSQTAFTVSDAPSAGATNSGSLVEALALPSQGNVQTDISGQIGDINNVLNVALTARGTIGSTIQTLSSIQNSTAITSTNETASMSTLTDTNVPAVTSQFTLMQTALQAAYLVTSRIEGHMLFDYIGG